MKQYLTNSEMYNYGIGWSNYFGRVVLPIYSVSHELMAYQLRKVDNRIKGPKYLTFKNREIQNGIYFRSNYYPDHMVTSMDIICIVEDIVSAIKVGRVCSGIALLGSPPNLPHIAQYLGNSGKVVVWLDRDKLKTAVRYIDTLNLLGYNAQMVLTQQDPKSYETDRILEEIHDR